MSPRDVGAVGPASQVPIKKYKNKKRELGSRHQGRCSVGEPLNGGHDSCDTGGEGGNLPLEVYQEGV